MLTLYHCVSARSFRPLWMLEELQALYQLHMLPFPPRALQRDYLEANPLGTVPLLVDGATRMTESAAMCQYLAERCDPGNLRGLSVRPDEAAFGDWLNWLHRNYSVRSLTMDELRRELGPTAPVLTGNGDWTYGTASP